MSRKLPTAIAFAVFLADAAAIIVSAGFLQTWVDSRVDAPPAWPGLLWQVSFFPCRFVLRLPAFNHPLGLGGPRDDYVWGRAHARQCASLGSNRLRGLATIPGETDRRTRGLTKRCG